MTERAARKALGGMRGFLNWGPVAVPALTALLWLVCPAPARAAEPAQADIDQGRELYDDFCASCHGRDLINPGGVTFDLRKFPKDQLERFRSSVLDGKPPAMPPWRDKLSGDDVMLLWAFVRNGG